VEDRCFLRDEAFKEAGAEAGGRHEVDPSSEVNGVFVASQAETLWRNEPKAILN
jgi:hypothetical protein